jgi:hypothetical protein
MEAVEVTAEADEEVLCPCSMSCRPCPPMRANVNIACLSSKTDGDPRLDVLDIGARLRLIVIKHLEDDELSTNRKKKRIERLYNNMCINSLDGGVVPINGRIVFKKLFGVL